VDLFSPSEEQAAAAAPLAARMRPRRLSEFLGQEQIVGLGTVLRRTLERGELFSMLFFGPPGTGKTTLARIIAGETGARFVQLSAVTSGSADVRAAIQGAREARALDGVRTILFIDEIHRFNKAQQDLMLPSIEDAVVTLIGATTENPFFEVNSALLSRCQLYRFEPLPAGLVERVVAAALADRERGLGKLPLALEPGSYAFLAEVSGGDARVALNALEAAVLALGAEPGGPERTITVAALRDAAQKSPVVYDREDAHYDTISAFIKSMRGSDPDAAVYYLASMLEGGEDPKFIARRMIVFASEDVGNADPTALQVAVAAARAVEFVGLPECRINLSQAATYLCLAPKSNAAYVAINDAQDEVRRSGNQSPPPHLRGTNYPGARRLGHGQGYKYPHAYGGHVEQQYLPDELAGRRYYRPIRGVERRLGERLGLAGPEDDDGPVKESRPPTDTHGGEAADGEHSSGLRRSAGLGSGDEGTPTGKESGSR
jgi:putative ATPase